jgi:hypothetical protein
MWLNSMWDADGRVGLELLEIIFIIYLVKRRHLYF